MRHSVWIPAASIIAALTFSGATAKAGVVLETSVGYGYRVSPVRGAEAASILVAPGVTLLGEMLRLELGFAGALSAAEDGDLQELNLELRPMLVIDPPLLPLYGRVTVAAIEPFRADRQIAYGGAIGISFSLVGLGVFAEVGTLPRSAGDEFAWIVEGRAGAYLVF
jgi:hypothetical protein